MIGLGSNVTLIPKLEPSELGWLSDLDLSEHSALLETPELSALLSEKDVGWLVFPSELQFLLPLLPPSDESPFEPAPSDQLNELLIESDELPFELAETLPFPFPDALLLDSPDGMTWPFSFHQLAANTTDHWAAFRPCQPSFLFLFSPQNVQVRTQATVTAPAGLPEFRHTHFVAVNGMEDLRPGKRSVGFFEFGPKTG